MKKPLSLRQALPFVVLAVIVGIVVVVYSFAAGTPIAFEAESGSLAGSAAVSTVAGQSGTGTVKFAGSSTGGPGVMKMISLNKPAFASSGIARDGNDSSYDTSWSPSGSGWLAYDLSAEPTANRQSVVLAWFTNPDDGHSVNGFAGACPAWSGRPYISDYTIQGNAAAGGTSSAPTTGWTTLATVSGNANLSGQHLINFAGYNWIRINGSGPNGIDVNVDVADASGGITDDWLFLGDSITTIYSGHFTGTDQNGTTVRSFTEGISAGTAAKYRPIQEDAAMSCTKSGDALVWIDSFLNAFPGKYVTLNFGTNDSWNASGDPVGYASNMQSLINKIKAKGKVAVISTIPWPNNAGGWPENIEAMNAKIQQLYTANPGSVIPGPDLYTLTKGHANYYQDPGNVHFNDLGASVARKAWIDAALTNIYNK
jgi:lysophospholipase L1-like esterase